MRGVFIAAASASVLAVLTICAFLFANGLPAFAKIGAADFLLGEKWKPTADIYGIFPMILGSLYVTAGAISLGVPLGILTAAYMARFASPRVLRVMRPATQLLAGIPSVVYGFFGLVVLVPFVRDVLGKGLGWGGNGNSMLTACILLGFMILPTVIQVAESSIRAVPDSYYEGSLALGASHERSVFFAQLPAARSGILAGVILGVGRAIGETMAVIMVAGNQARMPAGLMKGVRTLTVNIVMEMGYAADLHREALIASGVVLFVFILIINLLFSMLKRRAQA